MEEVEERGLEKNQMDSNIVTDGKNVANGGCYYLQRDDPTRGLSGREASYSRDKYNIERRGMDFFTI